MDGHENPSYGLKGDIMRETMVDMEVTYTLEHEGKFYVVEHVPARVCKETGEQFFSPETVEHIQSIIKGGNKPDRMIETPVYEYA
jgi:YgiT-type zinc finger domain-containing protein